MSKSHPKELPTSSEVRIVEADPNSPDAAWCLQQYYTELNQRFEGGFEAAKSIVADPGDFLPPSGVFLVAYVDSKPVGCGAVKMTSQEIGYIKRMWVDSSRRGLGLGRTLLRSLEDAARALGCSVVQLETNQSLREAIQLYRTSGYQEVEPFNDEHYAHHWFEKRFGASDTGST